MPDVQVTPKHVSREASANNPTTLKRQRSAQVPNCFFVYALGVYSSMMLVTQNAFKLGTLEK